MKSKILCVLYDEKLVFSHRALKLFQTCTARCARCSAKVLLSATSKELIKISGAEPVCQECARAEVAYQTAVLGVLPERLREVATMLLREATGQKK